MEIHTSVGEISCILKKLKDEVSANVADSHHAPLDAARKQEIVTVTIRTNLQGEAEEKEEVATETECNEALSE